MTEEEWLACDNAKAMVDSLKSPSCRKLQLFTCACCRRIWSFIAEPRQRAIEVAEQYADALVTRAEFNLAYVKASEDSAPRIKGEGLEALAATRSTLGLSDPGPDKCSTVYWVTHGVATATNDVPGEWKVQGDLFRDIFGNPFRPVAFDTEWRTPTVTALARQMYDSRDFGAMPILADALQDAGCDNDDILGHCRGPGPHVRGCWVVDLVLGKG